MRRTSCAITSGKKIRLNRHGEFRWIGFLKVGAIALSLLPARNERLVVKKLFAMLTVGAAGLATSQAATDITGVISDVSDYKDSAIVVGVAVLLFVLGRRVIRKLV